MSSDKDILKARQSLRKIYKKYATELFEITNKIDHYLEVLQDQKDAKN